MTYFRKNLCFRASSRTQYVSFARVAIRSTDGATGLAGDEVGGVRVDDGRWGYEVLGSGIREAASGENQATWRVFFFAVVVHPSVPPSVLLPPPRPPCNLAA